MDIELLFPIGVFFKRLMLVSADMVGRKIREYPGIEFNSVDAAHLEPYRRNLHADSLAAAVRHLAQNFLKLI